MTWNPDDYASPEVKAEIHRIDSQATPSRPVTAAPFLCPCCGARGTTDGKASTVRSEGAPPAAAGRWTLHRQPADQIVNHEFSIWLDDEIVLLANLTPGQTVEHLNSMVELLNGPKLSPQEPATAWQPIETVPQDQEVEVRGLWKLRGDGVLFTHWRPTLPRAERSGGEA